MKTITPTAGYKAESRFRSRSTRSDLDLQELWHRYAGNRNDADRERLVLNFAPLAKLAAGRLRARLPSHVEEAELISWGLMGLLGAIERYDPKRGVKFEPFAMIRIRGAMLDELRSLDWVPRKVRQDAHEIERAESSFMAEQKRPPTESELAECLGIRKDALQQRLLGIADSAIYSFDAPLMTGRLDGSDDRTLLDSLGSPGFADPQKELDDVASAEALKTNLADAVACLPERQQLILALYYREELRMREIGEVLGITESRISQLHAKALISLRAAMVR